MMKSGKKTDIKRWLVAGLLVCLTYTVQAAGLTVPDSVVRVVDIVIEGNQRTNPTIIKREMTLGIGDEVKAAELLARVERSQQNIFNLQLFISVSASVEQLTPQQVRICITVKERWYLLALPYLSLADRNFSEWWYERNRDLSRLTYGMQATHANLTGNNDQLHLKVLGGFVPYYEVAYRRPYIDHRQRMGIRGGVYFTQQRTIAYRTWQDKLDFFTGNSFMRNRVGGFAEFTLRNKLYEFHTFQLNYSRTSIADTIQTLNPFYFSDNGTNQQFASFLYDYRFDRRDNRQYALRGQVVNFQVSRLGLLPSDNVNQFVFSGLYQTYFPIYKQLFGDVSMQGRVAYPQQQPYSLMGGLGYRNALVRGYDLYVVDGQQYVLMKSNLKFRLLQRSFDLKRLVPIKQFDTLPIAMYAVGFADAGYVYNAYPYRTNSRLANRWLSGYGVGLDIVSWYDTMARFSYSFNQLGERRLFFTLVRGF